MEVAEEPVGPSRGALRAQGSRDQALLESPQPNVLGAT